MKNEKWEINEVKPLSQLNKQWLFVYGEIAQNLEFCSMRGDDVYNVNQIILNIMNSADRFGKSDARKTGFIWTVRLVENEYIEIVNDEYGELVLVFEIKRI